MFKKIDKREARRLYGKRDLILVPNKLYPGSMFGLYTVGPRDFECLTDVSFDAMVNAFEYYNCTPETGRRAAFYIET